MDEKHGRKREKEQYFVKTTVLNTGCERCQSDWPIRPQRFWVGRSLFHAPRVEIMPAAYVGIRANVPWAAGSMSCHASVGRGGGGMVALPLRMRLLRATSDVLLEGWGLSVCRVQ